MLHYRGESSTPGRMGSSLYASSAQGTRGFRYRSDSGRQATGVGRIYATSSRLKGQDSFPTPAVFDSSVPFQYTCSSRPTSIIQGTGAGWMLGGGACAVLVPFTIDGGALALSMPLHLYQNPTTIP